MAMTIAQDVAVGTGNSTDGLNFTGLTAGNGIVIFIQWDGSTNFGTLTFGTETLVEVGSVQTGSTTCCGTQSARMFFVKSLGGSGTINIATSVNVPWTVYFIEVSGQDTTTFLDTGVIGTGTGTGATTWSLSGALTTSAANDMIVAMGTGEVNIVADTGYTRVPASGAGNRDKAVQYNVDVGAAGAKTVQWTSTNPTTYIFRGAAFKAAAASASATPTVGAAVLAGIAGRMDLGIPTRTTLKI